MKQKPFDLFAVWIHQGYAGSGHYWAYIRNPHTNKWTKFNDMRVCEMDEETVMKEAVGGTANTSAYFLLYMDKEMVKSSNFDQAGINWNQFIPEPLMKEVKGDNEKFLKELEEYPKKHMDKFEQFCSKYQDTLAETEKNSSPNSVIDSRMKSYYSFLDSIERHEMMLAEVVRDTYESVFGRGIEKDVGTGMYDKIQDRIGKEMVVEATKIGFESTLTKPLRELYQKFQRISQLLESGLTALIEKKLSDALRAISAAYIEDKDLDREARRTNEITTVLGVCVLALIHEASKKIGGDEVPLGLSVLRQVVATVCNIFNPKNPSPISLCIKDAYLKLLDLPVTPSVKETLNDLKASLDGGRIPNFPFLAPTLEKIDSPSKIEQLCQRYSNALAKLQTEYKPFLEIIQHGLKIPAVVDNMEVDPH